ncbi:MAG: alpha-L-arabinofuranosidase [Bryobacteraceae bacterium]|nr:alpha-L-arabinofuranosidase [Bryobacteraceae bacterium]
MKKAAGASSLGVGLPFSKKTWDWAGVHDWAPLRYYIAALDTMGATFMDHDRRKFLRTTLSAAAGAASLPATQLQQASASLLVDPAPRFDISPHLYMQFMEPLGTTDSSLEAAWDYDKDDWRSDFIALSRDLAPGMVRYGGNYSHYYKWREGVGPVASRPRMRNYDWGGWETHRVGTHEFVDYCRRVQAEPLYCVNFLSDGRKNLWATKEGNRSGDAREAADWVSYCNDPDHRERRANGARDPLGVKIWQLGNETSYGTERFTVEQAIGHTIDFAKAMRQRDPSLKLIGWGDLGRGRDEKLWAWDMLDRAGEHLDYIAIHMMGQRPIRKDTVLRGSRYQAAPEQAWDELLEMTKRIETRVRSIEEAVAAKKPTCHIAITEGHLSLAPHNANAILLEWMTGVFHARSMNIYQRHGAKVKISTCADFCGSRWTVNALLMQVPAGVSYLTPAGCVMRLFGRHNGTTGVDLAAVPDGLDVAASRTGNRVWLHVANTNYRGSVEASLGVKGMTVKGGRVWEIAPPSLRAMVTQDEPEVFKPREAALPGDARWRFPAGSVSAVELDCA